MKKIFHAIQAYADAYNRLEQLQRAEETRHLIPIGDQKTGVIAEFYARIYAEHRFKAARIEFGSPSERGWDIKVTLADKRALKVQVKAVSAHSRSHAISPIHPGWDELWLIRLDVKLWPEAVWVIDAKRVDWAGQTLLGAKMPKPGSPVSGARKLQVAEDETALFVRALSRNSQTTHSRA
jgi:hypothetical protein